MQIYSPNTSYKNNWKEKTKTIKASLLEDPTAMDGHMNFSII